MNISSNLDILYGLYISSLYELKSKITMSATVHLIKNTSIPVDRLLEDIKDCGLNLEFVAVVFSEAFLRKYLSCTYIDVMVKKCITYNFNNNYNKVSIHTCQVTIKLCTILC